MTRRLSDPGELAEANLRELRQAEVGRRRAMDQIGHGPAVTAERLMATARHESGHGVAAFHFGFPIDGLEIFPDGRGHCWGLPYPRNMEQVRQLIIVLLAGGAADPGYQRGYPLLHYAGGAASDFIEAERLLELLVETGRLGTPQGWRGRRYRPIHWLDREARRFVAKHRGQIETVAEALHRERRLEAAEVAALIGGGA